MTTSLSPDITAIWNNFHQELRAFILKKTGNAADTDDLLQEIFIKIMRNKEKVGQAENLRQYLFGIVRNAVNDHFRSKVRYADPGELPDMLEVEEVGSLNAAIADCCIKPFINKLPEHYKEALLITEFQGISQEELAEKLNISYSGAKSRVQRGKEKLKELILDCCAYQSDAYGNLREAEKRNCDC
jgi:RNA polymerase sigma-70 factor (ECF subfamily)